MDFDEQAGNSWNLIKKLMKYANFYFNKFGKETK